MNTILHQTANEIQQLTYDLVHYCSICDRVSTQRLGVTVSQGYILLAMPESDNITMNELSVKMRLANSTMTRMVDQLVQKRLVIRETDPQDRRIVLVHLTDKGREERSTFRSTLQDIFSQVLGELSVEEREDVLYSLRSLNSAILKTLNSCCSDEGV